MIESLSGPERRRRRTPQEKIAIVQQTMEPGMTVSHVARLNGVNANQVFTWRRQYQNGSLTAVSAGEDVVPASELTAAMKQIKELQRLLGKKTMEVELLKEAVEYGRAKKLDSARTLVARGYGLTLTSRCLNVSRAQLSLHIHRASDWQDGRRRRTANDAELIARIMRHIAELSTYGYRRVWALLRKESEHEGAQPVNAKRVYRVMRDNQLLLERKGTPVEARAHNGKVAVAQSDKRWCSDGFEFNCDNGDKLRVTFALDCCDREALDWIGTNGGYTSDIVMDVMMNSVSKRFGNRLPEEPIEFLSDNGSCYTAKETRAFSRQLNLEQRTTAVRSPQSNGMAESFVKTMKRDYISVMPKPNREVALINLAVAFEHYNDKHPHSALGYRSPREYRRRRESLT
ncbi:IS3 family transposase [Escherichia coli]|nr:IS3 family transposase [Escherichia coli]EKN2132074.1 IS3 family transposase [Escherichia coli]